MPLCGTALKRCLFLSKVFIRFRWRPEEKKAFAICSYFMPRNNVNVRCPNKKKDKISIKFDDVIFTSLLVKVLLFLFVQQSCWWRRKNSQQDWLGTSRSIWTAVPSIIQFASTTVYMISGWYWKEVSHCGLTCHRIRYIIVSKLSNNCPPEAWLK